MLHNTLLLLKLTLLLVALNIYASGSAISDTGPKAVSDSTTGLHLTGVSFDSTCHAFRISWELDTNSRPAFIVIAGAPVDGSPLNAVSDTIEEPELRDTVLLYLDKCIIFDTTYTIQVSTFDSIWSNLDQSGNASALVRTCRADWQPFAYFENNDSVGLFNNSIMLWKDASYEADLTIDTALIYSLPAKVGGFQQAGTGFSFKIQQPSPALYVGIRITNATGDRSLSDVRIYRDSAGCIILDPSCRIDIPHRIAYVKTNDLDHPFIALIDTLPPSVRFLSDTSSILAAGQELTDTVAVSDNSFNAQWSFMYSKGDGVPLVHTGDYGRLAACTDTLLLTIPSSTKTVTEDNGVRAIFTLSDGIISKQVNISRRVSRAIADEFAPVDMQWTPLHVTAQLYNPEPESVFAGIKQSGEDEWRYDITKMRLFRWAPLGSGTSMTESWIEFGSKTGSPFLFEPCKVFWIKTRDIGKISTGSGVTLSLKDTVESTLVPGNWTDLSIPFRFDMQLSSILDATGGSADSLSFYTWVKDVRNNIIVSKGIYIKGISDLDNRNILLTSTISTFAVYNPFTKEVTLRIPPVAAIQNDSIDKAYLQKNAAGKKRIHGNGWFAGVKILNFAGECLKENFCGSTGVSRSSAVSDTARTFPLSPNLPGLSAGILGANGYLWEHLILNRGRNEGAIFTLSFHNQGSGKISLLLKTDSLENAPDAFVSCIFNNNGPDSMVTLGPEESAIRWLVVGDDSYLGRWKTMISPAKFTLEKIHMMPGGRIVFTMSIPYSGIHNAGIDLIDAAGRLAAHTVRRVYPGTAVISFDPPLKTRLSRGLYIAKITGLRADNTPAVSLRTGFICIH